MPSGHTDKQTVTPYRQRLLDRLPLHTNDLGSNERKQLNDLCRFGLARQTTDGWFRRLEAR